MKIRDEGRDEKVIKGKIELCDDRRLVRREKGDFRQASCFGLFKGS
jgi:hypothetical protein